MKQSEKDRQIPYDFIYMYNLNNTNEQTKPQTDV